MKKMYINTLLACIAMLVFNSAMAEKPKFGRAEIVTEEFDRLTGVITGKVTLYALDTIEVTQAPTFKFPKGWDVTAQFPGYIFLNEGDSIVLSFTLQYPTSNIPFYPEEFEIEISLRKYQPYDKEVQAVRAIGKVHFTPYNTVEIFSAADFENIYRAWHSPESNIPTLQAYIPRDQIPVSDLNLEKDTANGMDQDSIEVRYIRIAGLSYDIPMKVDRSAIPPGEEDDGPDSTIFRTAGDGDPAARRRRFTGTVTGRITSDIINDVLMNRRIPLSGIYIKLKERDRWFDEDFGITHCDENGFFTIRYDEMQSGLEGHNIELYIVIQSKNKNYDIKAKRTAILGSSFEQIRDLGSFGQTVGVLDGSINTNIRGMRVTSWAVRSWEYCQNAGGHGLHSDLSILPGANGSNFVADGFLGISLPFTKPTIRLTSGDCDQENTTYHEFGHFLMWNIQNRNYITVYSDPDQSGHSWERENTPELAWSEGWADAHQMIMDAAHWWEDQEYGYDDLGLFQGARYENRVNRARINNGIWAEYYVATAIYDLWDGSQAGIPDFIPTIFGPVRVGNDDAAGWATIDDVNWQYMWILHPIAWNGGSSGKLRNIEEYFYWFRDHVVGAVDCIGRANVARVFRENRVMQDINDFNTNPPGNDTSLSGDELYIPITLTYRARFVFNSTRSVTHRINPPNNYFQTATRTMDFNFGSGVSPFINENLFVTGAAGVPNSRIRINPNFTTSAFASGTLTTCDNPRLTFTFSNFELGGAQTRARVEISGTSLWQFNNGANLILNANSAFVVRSGSTLHIRNGSSVNLAAGASIIVENGGYICIEAGAIITQQPGAAIVLQPGWILGVNPVLGITTTGCTQPPPPPPAPNEALQFDGANDFVDIPNNNGGFNLGAGNFTWEAYVRLNPTAALQVILSNRTVVNGGVADGFMFAVWGGGQPFVQLAGTPNIQPVTPTLNLMDGNCHHVAVTRNGTLISFYVDGQFVANGTDPSTRNINSPGTLLIGIDRLTPNPLNGWVGEVRYWNVARTNAQIAASVNANLTTPVAGLVSYYDMRDNAGSQVLTDVSGNGVVNNGRLGNSVAVDAQDPVWLTPAQVNCSVGGNFRMITVVPNYPDSSAVNKSSVENRSKVADNTFILTRVVVQPNPTATAFTLLLPQGYKPVEIEVVNAGGAVLERLKFRQGQTSVRFGEKLGAGFYVLRIKSSEGIETIKLIKQ